MSPTTLGLSVLGLTTISTGIGIAVVNLTNTNNESIEEKIEKLWEEIKENIKNLISQVNKIMQNQNSDISKKYINFLAKITEIADTTVQSGDYKLKLPKNSESTYQQLQNINEELQEIIKSLN